MRPMPSLPVSSTSAWHISWAWARDSSAQGPAISVRGRSLAMASLPTLTVRDEDIWLFRVGFGRLSYPAGPGLSMVGRGRLRRHAANGSEEVGQLDRVEPALSPQSIAEVDAIGLHLAGSLKDVSGIEAPGQE